MSTPASIKVTGDAIAIGDRTAPFVLRRSKRARRLLVKVDAQRGGVTLVIPQRAALGEAMRFLEASSGWIETRLAALPGRIAFGHGTVIPVRGIDHHIRHNPGRTRDAAGLPRGSVWVEAQQINVAGQAEHLPRRVRDWLRQSARQEFADRACRMAVTLDRSVKRISIRDSKTRWGSCSNSGALSFSWRLLMAPDFVIDYLIAHEVAHLVHMDHSRKFWTVVQQLTPTADQARRWLRQHGASLHRYGDA